MCREGSEKLKAKEEEAKEKDRELDDELVEPPHSCGLGSQDAPKVEGVKLQNPNPSHSKRSQKLNMPAPHALHPLHGEEEEDEAQSDVVWHSLGPDPICTVQAKLRHSVWFRTSEKLKENDREEKDRAEEETQSAEVAHSLLPVPGWMVQAKLRHSV